MGQDYWVMIGMIEFTSSSTNINNIRKLQMEFTKASKQVEAKSVSKWNKGETFIGYLKSVDKIKTKMSEESILYKMVEGFGEEFTPDGAEVHFWSGSGLNHLMSKVQDQQICKITCLGKEKNPKTGMTYVKFEVETANKFLHDWS